MPKVVGDVEGANVMLYEKVDASGMNSIAATGKMDRATSCRMTTIDAFCRRHHIIPDVVKMDVEGAEVQGLKGALEVLMQYRPTVFLSVHPRQIVALGYSTSELRQIIDEIGYQVWDIAKNEVCHGNLGFGEFRLERIAEVRSL